MAKKTSPLHRLHEEITAESAWASSGNRLLATFPRSDHARIAPYLEQVMLDHGAVLYEPGCIPAYVHFPHQGTMISRVVPMRDGSMTETVVVGLEGLAGIGVDATDTTVETFTRGVVQMPGAAARLPAARLAHAAAAAPPLRRLLSRYAEAAMSMALQSAACNATHRLQARLARWLLMAHDRAGPATHMSNASLPLTQQFLAEMLSVRRATIVLKNLLGRGWQA